MAKKKEEILSSFKKSTESTVRAITNKTNINIQFDNNNVRQHDSISLPRIKKNFNMNFYKWSFNKPLKINKYGIPEPNSKIIIYPDILFVPLVGFDNKLNRLGYGGGYYDRYISKLQGTPRRRSPGGRTPGEP